MRIEDERESQNVEDMRGASGGGGFPMGGTGIGIGGLLSAVVASMVFGVDPRMVLNVLQGGGAPPQAPVATGPAPRPPAEDEKALFVSRVLATTEDTWSAIFAEAGKCYPAPRLVLFTRSYPTACGMGQSAAGPFYCPADRKVYIDLGFYQLMRERFHASGDFAEVYVIAHAREV